jgi:excisionase family DNA binding protein
MDLIDEGKYSHDCRLDRWITFTWNRYFFPEKKQEVGGYLKTIRFTNNLDPSKGGYRFESHCVNTTKITSNGLDRQSTRGAVSVDRVLRELDNPKSPFFALSDFAKTALTAMSKGQSLKQIAERADISPRHAKRLVNNAQSDIQRILQKEDFSEVLSSIQGAADWEEHSNVVCITDGEFVGDICGAAEDVSFEPLLSAREAAKLLGVHEKTIQALARSGEIPCLRFGKYWKFRESSLDAWVRDGLTSGNQSRRVS